ncbi:sulfate transporter [Salpingoeca rosetta]|uniref:Sulfate transporter n=1 Tax=Salpingoeca rosetta (strain ATCC 50818 / BSB-021) TaxID=946362 RepID=F2UDK3_SALR5|nr:sulfate transporter [Salpingoeca rosetta]EGD74698.1 sulfate transporter [Salpingoeca rosetta]|eukprot:XP_004992955.1 sulfate transporter [Salpingoeca rosetta]
MALEYERERTFAGLAGDYALSLVPIVRWLPKYTLSKARNDFIAGLTVGLMVVPQALAYASIAGLDEQYGLYSAFMGCFVYVFLGTAKDITLGPTAIMSLLTASNSDQVDGKTVPAHAIFLTFMAGVIQLGMGLLRLGFIVDFISYPVISGFTSAAAITIGFGQVKHLFGLRGVRRPFTQCVYDTFRKLNHTIVPDLLLGFVCIVALYLLKTTTSKPSW